MLQENISNLSKRVHTSTAMHDLGTVCFHRWIKNLSAHYAALTTCTAADAPVLRFIFNAAMQPLITNIMSWAHSVAAPLDTFFPKDFLYHPLPNASAADTFFGGITEPEAHLPQLPHFLRPVQRKLLLAGYQLRFLATLQSCAPTVAALERNGVLQMQHLREVQGNEQRFGGNTGARVPQLGKALQEASTSLSLAWSMELAWDWPTADKMAQVLTASQVERSLLVAGLISDLEAQRRSTRDTVLAAQLAALQARQAALVKQEQVAEAARAQLRHQKQQLLEEQQAELDEREHARTVR
jgi:hypothetical protein